MRFRLHTAILCGIALLIGSRATAQVEIGVTPAALIAFQPTDDSYVGGPYLSEGIGGSGPGFGAGVDAIAANGFVAAAEYSTARFEQEQYGRLVRGEGNRVTTRLRDSLLSVLGGYATQGTTRLVFLGGVSFRLDRATIDDTETFATEGNTDLLPAFTGGVDLLRSLSPRVQVVASGRYTFNERDTRLQYLGIGPHILRGRVGIRFRLN